MRPIRPASQHAAALPLSSSHLKAWPSYHLSLPAHRTQTTSSPFLRQYLPQLPRGHLPPQPHSCPRTVRSSSPLFQCMDKIILLCRISQYCSLVTWLAMTQAGRPQPGPGKEAVEVFLVPGGSRKKKEPHQELWNAALSGVTKADKSGSSPCHQASASCACHLYEVQ